MCRGQKARLNKEMVVRGVREANDEFTPRTDCEAHVEIQWKTTRSQSIHETIIMPQRPITS